MRRTVIAVVVLGAVAWGGIALLGRSTGYTVDVVVPSAAQLLPGSPVWIDGLRAGSVKNLAVRDGKAVVTVRVDDSYAPLHSGTTSQVEWNSVVGERMFTLYPGAAKNAVIPSGGMFESESRQIEIDQVLATLDAPTRARLNSVVAQLDATTKGNADDIQATLKSLAPAASALGEVLKGVGRDGPAIRALVTQLQEMTTVAVKHRTDVENTVQNLTALTGSVAQQESALSDTLRDLPQTLRQAKVTLDKVPRAEAATTPLLKDLDPATARLADVAGNLSPVLRDLRPTVAELRPMLADAQSLLGQTPGLLDGSHQVIPPVTSAVKSYQPALAFLRPYTPELIGWLHNFGQSFAGYDGQGHFWAATLAPGANAFNDHVVTPPTSYEDPTPPPGDVVGQPWTDANGNGIK